MNTLAFLAQQGLLERFDRGVHFEPLAKRRRAYATNFVVAQAAGKVDNATISSKRCCKQRTAVNTLAFFAQQDLQERLDRGVHFESFAQCRRSYVPNFVEAQAAERITNAKIPSERCSRQRIEVDPESMR